MTPYDDSKHYRAQLAFRFPVNNGDEIVFLPESGAVRLMPGTRMDMLSNCSRFATLSEHSETIARLFPLAEDTSEVRAILWELAGAGAMVTAEELYAECLRHAPPVRLSAGPIEWLAVPTKGRTPALLRCLRSYAGNRQRYGRNYKLLVVEDTARGRSSRDELTHLARELGVPIWYAGNLEKELFATLLSKKGNIPLSENS